MSDTINYQDDKLRWIYQCSLCNEEIIAVDYTDLCYLISNHNLMHNHGLQIDNGNE